MARIVDSQSTEEGSKPSGATIRNNMTIYRHKKDGFLYKIFLASPCMYTGRWHEAEPLFPGCGRVRKSVDLKQFVPVAHR